MRLPRLDMDSPARGRRARRRLLVGTALLVGGAWGLWACGGDAHLADHAVRDVNVGPIAAYGKRLDEQASPKEVVYVFLQAVVADYDAAADHAARETAFDVQLGTCAAEKIKTSFTRGRDPSERDRIEQLYRVVRRWAPVLGHYREDFRTGFDALADRMLLVPHSSPEGAAEELDIYLNVAHPSGDANAAVVARFRLIKEAGFWRIWWVGWENSTRDWRTRLPTGVKLSTAAATRPAAPPAESPASRPAGPTPL